MSWHVKKTGAYGFGSLEFTENGWEITNFLRARGFKDGAISAMVGNMYAESGLNPWRWQSDKVLSSTDTAGQQGKTHGYGLMQYTPAYKYITAPAVVSQSPDFGVNFSDVAGNTRDGNAQLIYFDTQPGWIKTSKYPVTLAEFKDSTDSVSYLVEVFFYCYERGVYSESSMAMRKDIANRWYAVIHGIVPPTKKLPAWLIYWMNKRGV